jgi:hypothetical protein
MEVYHLVMTFTVCHGKIHPFLMGKPWEHGDLYGKIHPFL